MEVCLIILLYAIALSVIIIVANKKIYLIAQDFGVVYLIFV